MISLAVKWNILIIISGLTKEFGDGNRKEERRLVVTGGGWCEYVMVV